MPGNGTQYQSPLMLQLIKNREMQLAAEAQSNPEGAEHRLEIFTMQPTEGDLESAIEWIGVFFQVFWLALLSGSFLLILICALKLAGY